VADYDRLRALVLQLTNRVKSLEAMSYDAVTIPGLHQAAVETGAALGLWKTAVTARPADHGLGGAEGLLLVALCKGIALRGLPDNVDQGLRARLAGLIYVLVVVLEMPPAQVGIFCKHLIVAPLQGNRAGTTLLVYGIEGRISLPQGDQIEQAVSTIVDSLRDGNLQALRQESARSFSLQDGIPAPTNGAGISLQHLITTLLCCTGGTRSTGKPPPSAAERVVRKGKGKGKQK